MGSDSDLQWTCDPAFARWLAPRLLDVDVIHAHMLGAWWATATVANGSVPLIASEHNGYEWNQKPPWAAMADVADRIDRFLCARAGRTRGGVARRGRGRSDPSRCFTGRRNGHAAPVGTAITPDHVHRTVESR